LGKKRKEKTIVAPGHFLLRITRKSVLNYRIPGEEKIQGKEKPSCIGIQQEVPWTLATHRLLTACRGRDRNVECKRGGGPKSVGWRACFSLDHPSLMVESLSNRWRGRSDEERGKIQSPEIDVGWV